MADENTSIQIPFDYTLLDEVKRLRVQRRTEAIKVRIKRTVEDIIAIGQDLIEVKRELEHGQFQHWLKAEFEMSYDTAVNFMQVAKKFGGREEIKSGNFPDLSASILYELAGPKVPNQIVEGVLQGDIEPTLRAIKEAKEAQRKAEEELNKAQQERKVIETRVWNINCEEQLLQEELRKVREERDRLKRELEGGLQAYYDRKLQMKAENTFFALLTHAIERLAEAQQVMDHIVTPGMLREVRRLGDEHPDRFLLLVAQVRMTYRVLYEAEIKLTGPLKDESTIVDEEPQPE